MLRHFTKCASGRYPNTHHPTNLQWLSTTGCLANARALYILLCSVACCIPTSHPQQCFSPFLGSTSRRNCGKKRGTGRLSAQRAPEAWLAWCSERTLALSILLCHIECHRMLRVVLTHAQECLYLFLSAAQQSGDFSSVFGPFKLLLLHRCQRT